MRYWINGARFIDSFAHFAIQLRVSCLPIFHIWQLRHQVQPMIFWTFGIFFRHQHLLLRIWHFFFLGDLSFRFRIPIRHINHRFRIWSIPPFIKFLNYIFSHLTSHILHDPIFLQDVLSLIWISDILTIINKNLFALDYISITIQYTDILLINHVYVILHGMVYKRF